MQHVCSIGRGEHCVLHKDSPTTDRLRVYKHFDQAKQGVSLSPLHSCHLSPRAAISGRVCQRTHSTSYTREAQKQIMQQRERKKLAACFSYSPNSLRVRINFKGHQKMLTDWRQAGSLRVDAFHCHQHKSRCLGSTSAIAAVT